MSAGLRATLILGAFLALSANAWAQTPGEPAAPPVRGGGVEISPDVEKPTPPDGDPRSTEQRREDRAAFNRCLLSRQDRPEDSFSNPGLPPDPLMYCQQRLGMRDGNDVPLQTRAKQR
jgi:hypothetical protein